MFEIDGSLVEERLEMAVTEDLKVKTDDQLQEQLIELKREQFNLRFQAATNQLEKPSRVTEVRGPSRGSRRFRTSAPAKQAAKA
jgi:large subunit ribosomal protein L29